MSLETKILHALKEQPGTPLALLHARIFGCRRDHVIACVAQLQKMGKVKLQDGRCYPAKAATKSVRPKVISEKQVVPPEVEALMQKRGRLLMQREQAMKVVSECQEDLARSPSSVYLAEDLKRAQSYQDAIEMRIAAVDEEIERWEAKI